MGSLWGVGGDGGGLPRPPGAVDEDGRTLTWAEARTEAERAAAGLSRLGIEAGDVVSWQLPTWLEAKLLVLALARLGAIQNPMLPIYREREVGFITRQAKSKLLVVPSTWAGFDFEAMARGIAAQSKADGGSLQVLVADKALPQGDPSALPPPPDPSDDAVRWYFYTSGTTADPKGAQHTDRTILASALGMNACLEVTDADRNAVVFPFTHIGGIGWLFSASPSASPPCTSSASTPPAPSQLIRQHDVTMAGAGTPFHMAYLAAQRQLPAGERLFPSVRVYCGGGAPEAAAAALRRQGRDGRRRHRLRLRLTEAPIIAMGTVNDTDEQLAHTEGKAPGTTAADRHPRGQGGRHR